MTDNDIELEDIQIVDVTGKAYRDRQPKNKKKGFSCDPSLRATTILIFLCIGVIYVVGVIIANVRMRVSLSSLDEGTCKDSIDRFALLMHNDMLKMQQLTKHAAWSDITAQAISHVDDKTLVDTFIKSFLNNSMSVDEKGNYVFLYNIGSEINYWAMINSTTYETVWSYYFPSDGNNVAGPNLTEPSPRFPPKFFKEAIKGTKNPTDGWLSLYNPDVVKEPMIVSFEAIMVPDDSGEIKDKTVYGYLVAARTIRACIQQFSDSVPSCISMISLDKDLDDFDKTDKNMWNDSEPGTFTESGLFSGTPSFVQRESSYLMKSKTRVCPAVRLFNATDNLMSGYFKLCGFDPKDSDESSCFSLRIDRPMSMVDQGTGPVITLSVEIVAMMIILCIFFVVFLDCVVLRRIVNLSNVIRKQTRGHQEAMKGSEEDSTTTMSVTEEKYGGSHSASGKRGKSALGSTDNSRTTTSSDGGYVPSMGSDTSDEIGNLKRVMEQNAHGLRRRLDAVNESIRSEQQKTIRHKQAMQLLNLWCGRKDYFPGLRPNAIQLRYEPTRTLDDLLANPLAIEYLKSHCDSDRSLENLWFLLDVSWLQELESAEDNEQDPEKRKQIHDVASSSAVTILSRYIAVNAPQQINISAATFKTLRGKGDVYERGMFEDAVGEVKLMLNTDILPRFQKSAAYSAMSETLFIDSSGGGDESEFSDETVSTAGSILTDEGEDGEGGVTRVFAHTFKNLHTTFDVGPDTDASSTYSADSTRAANALMGNVPITASLVAGTQTTSTTERNTTESSKDDSSVASSEKKASSKKGAEPAEQKPKKEKSKPAKKNKGESSKSSSDSTDSSGHSVSSNSVSVSGSESSSSSD